MNQSKKKLFVVGAVAIALCVAAAVAVIVLRKPTLGDINHAIVRDVTIYKVDQRQTSVCVEKNQIYGGDSKVVECFMPLTLPNTQLKDGDKIHAAFFMANNQSAIAVLPREGDPLLP